MKNTVLYVILAFVAALPLTGCQSDQKTDAELRASATDTSTWTLDDLTSPIDRPKTQKSFGDYMPWNWFGEEEVNEKDEVLFAEEEWREKSIFDKIKVWESHKVADEPSQDMYVADLSPELMSLSERPGELNNRVRRTVDTNLRSIWDDLLSLLLLDRPSRANRIPVP